MKKVFALIFIVFLGFVGFKTIKYQIDQQVKEEKKEGEQEEYNVIDGLIGRQAVGQYVRIREMKDTFNIPAFKTTMVMFYTQNGRYPNSIEELERSGDANRDMTHDRFGNPYFMQVRDNKHVLLQSAGKDKIKGTTDDVEYQFDL